MKIYMEKANNYGIYSELIQQYADYKRSKGYKMVDIESRLHRFDMLTIERNETEIGISRDLCKFSPVCSSVCIHKKLFWHLFRTTHKQGERYAILPVWFFVFYLAVRCIARKFLILPKSDQITRQTK